MHMLDGDTEKRLDAIWISMSDALRKVVMSAVEASLMNAEFVRNGSSVYLFRDHDELTSEIEHIIASGRAVDEPVFEPVLFGRHSASMSGRDHPGKHDERLNDPSRFGFKLGDNMRLYLLERLRL